MASYGSLAELKEWLSENTNYLTDAEGGSYDTLLTRLLADASDDFRARTGTEFHKTTAEAREFFGRRDGSVWLAGSWLQSSAPTIELDTTGNDVVDTTLGATDYMLLPKIDETGLKAIRWWRIVMSKSSARRFLPGQLVQVTGDWGYTDGSGNTPGGVDDAVLIKAARLFMRKSTPLMTVAMPGAGVNVNVGRLDHDYENAVDIFTHPAMRAP